MQLYFLKATYTNNVYKLTDFFNMGEYKINPGKMLDINFRPDDGLSSFITKMLDLPDGTSLRDQTHVIIPEYQKIYRIATIDYMNVSQWNVTLDDDPLIANYQDLALEDIILMRNNDPEFFRGVNDINDLTLKETVETKVMSSVTKTGKWALIFMQYNPDKNRYGLKFSGALPLNHYPYETTLSAIITKNPEVTTTTPQLYNYFQKIIYASNEDKLYQCVYDGTQLLWTEYMQVQSEVFYFKLDDAVGSKFSQSDIRNIVIALPFESSFATFTDQTGIVTGRLISYNSFAGVVDGGEVIDVKIVDDILLPFFGTTYTKSGTDDRIMTKNLESAQALSINTYATSTATSANTSACGCKLIALLDPKEELTLDPEYITTAAIPIEAEPFKHYDLYIFGKKFSIPYYLTDDLKLLIAINSGVINYTIYYNDRRYILGAGSFTHSVRWQFDKLDQFYNQNPTYRDQFYLKMATDATKTIVGGAIAGSVVPGIGTVAGAAGGIVAAGVDAGLSQINFNFMEKSLRLQPDQIFGEISELTMQLINIFGIYFVKRTPENADMMKNEYDLRGYPTTRITKISDLDYATSFFGQSKVIYGELKKVVRNEYTTGFINQKLKEGVVFVL